MTTFITFDWPASTEGTVVNGINDAGQIVGTYRDNIGGGIHGFVYLGIVGANLDFPTSDGIHTTAYGINNAITVVGSYDDGGFIHAGFLWSGGTYTGFAPFSNVATLATGINDAGQVVGNYATSNLVSHGFVKSGNTYTTLDDPLGTSGTAARGINNLGQVVGVYFREAKTHGFLYS